MCIIFLQTDKKNFQLIIEFTEGIVPETVTLLQHPLFFRIFIANTGGCHFVNVSRLFCSSLGVVVWLTFVVNKNPQFNMWFKLRQARIMRVMIEFHVKIWRIFDAKSRSSVRIVLPYSRCVWWTELLSVKPDCILGPNLFQKTTDVRLSLVTPKRWGDFLWTERDCVLLFCDEQAPCWDSVYIKTGAQNAALVSWSSLFGRITVLHAEIKTKHWAGSRLPRTHWIYKTYR